MCDSLKLEKFFTQSAQIDIEWPCWGWALGKGEGKEFVVVLGRGARGYGFVGGWRCSCALKAGLGASLCVRVDVRLSAGVADERCE